MIEEGFDGGREVLLGRCTGSWRGSHIAADGTGSWSTACWGDRGREAGSDGCLRGAGACQCGFQRPPSVRIQAIGDWHDPRSAVALGVCYRAVRRVCETGMLEAAAVCCFSGVGWAISGVLPDSTRACKFGGGKQPRPALGGR
jgi:hypothetical protein